jgi:hypothetical protein
VSEPTPWRVRLLAGFVRAVRLGYALADAAAAGVALGLMDRRHLHALDRLHYDRAAAYHGQEHNLRGLFDWEREAVDRWFRDCRTLVVVGAGAGREVLALAATGFEVDGFECNARLVETAAQLLAAQDCDARVLPLARDAAPSTSRGYDGLIAGWSAYMLIPGRAQRIAFLHGMAALAEAGAPVLLSFFTRPPEHRRYPRVARVANVLRRLRRSERVEVGDDLVPNFVHRFTEDEIRAELDEGGFEMVAFAAEGRGPYDSGWAVGRRR